MIARRSGRCAAVWVALLVASFLALGSPLRAAGLYQPTLAFRVLATAHFRIYFHQGLEPMARRLAIMAEDVRVRLPALLYLNAPSLTHVVLDDQDDQSNGSASVLPYDTIRLAAIWPEASDLIGNTDDWLRIVFIHEYAHLLQLDQSRGWASVARRLLGRSPVTFPNLFLPQWQIEGFATYAESRATGQGRLNGGDSLAIRRDRARWAGAEPIDRASGGAVRWPGGQSQYLDGGGFYEYLAARDLGRSVAEVDRRSAGRVPYLAAPVFKDVFKKSLGQLWDEYQGVRIETAGTPDPLPVAASRLTHHGFVVSAPRFVDSGRSLIYSVRDADRLPSLMRVDASGTHEPERLATRFNGVQASQFGSIVFFDELELRDSTAWRSDLRAIDLESGRTVRLTDDARLLAPAVSADGTRLVAIREDNGVRHLVLFAVTGTFPRLALEPLPSPFERDQDGLTYYGAPRWSPDARRLAVERRRRGGVSEIVVFDVATGAVSTVAASKASRVITPTWSPDGRQVLYAADTPGTTFQIVAVAADDPSAFGRPLTNEPGGATWPEVSNDGKRLVFVGSRGDGYDLFDVPIDLDGPGLMSPPVRQSVQQISSAVSPTVGGADTTANDPATPVGSYSPVPTLWPRAWTPIAQTTNERWQVGFATDGMDVLNRHAWAVSAVWRVVNPTDSIGGTHAGRPDWSAQYVYSRWRPSFFVAASDETSFLSRTSESGLALPDAERRERQLAIGAAVPFSQVRHSQVLRASFAAQWDTVNLTGTPVDRRRHALKAAWAFSNAHQYGYSVSAEHGVSFGVTTEQVRTAFGADGNADAATLQTRVYLPIGGPHAVLALRGAYGASTGDAGVRRVFYLGGTTAAGALTDSGSDALNLLRGFGANAFAGYRTAVMNVEWRKPVWRLERGWGTFPLFVRTFSASAFVDAGHAWTTDFKTSALKTSVGVEASADVVAGFTMPLTVSVGVCATRDGAATGRTTGHGVYVRLGRSF